MNDPVSNPGLPASELEEPPSWWWRLRHLIRRLFGIKPRAEALREAVVELIEETPTTGTGERMLLANILKLRERRVADCMMQRADIDAADVNSNLKEIVDIMAAHGHSRIPIYRGTLDDVIGMVHMKDIMACLAHQQSRTLPDLLRPVLFVAPSTPVLKLLLQMRQTRQHMALVVDEYGGIDGLVTIEDLVEEITGEIEDEHDMPSPAAIIARADGTLLVDGRIPLEEFEARIGMELNGIDSEEVDTLGGYVVSLAGRIPNIGEAFRNSAGLDFEVLEMDQSRVKRLRVKGLKRAEPPAPSAAPVREPAAKAARVG